jgi:hypothetical protein
MSMSSIGQGIGVTSGALCGIRSMLGPNQTCVPRPGLMEAARSSGVAFCLAELA